MHLRKSKFTVIKNLKIELLKDYDGVDSQANRPGYVLWTMNMDYGLKLKRIMRQKGYFSIVLVSHSLEISILPFENFKKSLTLYVS